MVLRNVLHYLILGVLIIGMIFASIGTLVMFIELCIT